MKPGVVREDRRTKIGRDFFNSRKKVHGFCVANGEFALQMMDFAF